MLSTRHLGWVGLNSLPRVRSGPVKKELEVKSPNKAHIVQMTISKCYLNRMMKLNCLRIVIVNLLAFSYIF